MDSGLTVFEGVQILYEDNHLIVCVKPAGVLSQGDGSDAQDMLTILKKYIKQKYDKPGEVFLGLVHRLDRPVSGVMVFARTSKAASRLSEQIRSGMTEKYYRCIVEGLMEGEGKLENYILKDAKTNSVTIYDKPTADAKYAVLEYKALKQESGRTLVQIKLGTGRAHQIRAQLARSGHPIAGDRKYGKDSKADYDIALQSFRLEFDHPTKKERMAFEIPMPSCAPWFS